LGVLNGHTLTRVLHLHRSLTQSVKGFVLR